MGEMSEEEQKKKAIDRLYDLHEAEDEPTYKEETPPYCYDEEGKLIWPVFLRYLMHKGRPSTSRRRSRNLQQE